MKINLQANVDSQASEYCYHQFVRFIEEPSPEKTFFCGCNLKMIRFNDDGSFDEKYARKNKKYYKKWKDYDGVVWIIRIARGFVFLTDKNEFYRTEKAPFAPVHAEPMKLRVGVKYLSETKPDDLFQQRYESAKWRLYSKLGHIPGTRQSLFNRMMELPTGCMSLLDKNVPLGVEVVGEDGIVREIPDAASITMSGDKVIVTSLKDGPIYLDKSRNMRS